MKCCRCKQAIEDTRHCLWDFIKAKEIWNWVTYLILLMSQEPSQFIAISPQQALLGDVVDYLPAIPQHWWTALQITTIWHIWLDRNSEVRQNNGSFHHTKARIWHQMRAYLRSASWTKLSDRVKSRNITDNKEM